MSKRSRKAQVWIFRRGARAASPPEVLLFQVVSKRGSGWHPVTGGVDDGETEFQGAKRELKEETGFSGKQLQWIDLKYQFKFEGRFGPAQESAFLAILAPDSSDPKIDSHEHVAFEWCAYEEALRRVEFPSQKEALKLALQAFLK